MMCLVVTTPSIDLDRAIHYAATVEYREENHI